MQSISPFVRQYEQSRPCLAKNSSPAPVNNFIGKVRCLIQLNFDNELFDVAELARQTHLSISQLNRKLNKYIHLPAGQLIWEMKMEYAAHLLAQGEATIGDVAYKVGYKNQAHFCRSFKRKFSCTPSTFRGKAMG